MLSHFFVTADVTPNKSLKVAFSSMFLKRKKSQRFGASSFSKFHHTRRKNPFVTPRTVLQRAKKSLCNGSKFRTLLLPHRFIKIRPSRQRPVSIEFLTICRIPEFPKSEQNRKSCGNVRIHGSEPIKQGKFSEISQRHKCFSELKISNPRISCTLNGKRRSS